MTIELKDVKEIDDKDVGEEDILWEPASNLQQLVGLDLVNFVYRWVDKSDPQNFARKVKEGWLVDNTVDGSRTEHTRANKLDNGANLTPSVKDSRGLILMKLPKKLAEARKKYYQKRADEQLGMVTQQIKQEGKGVIYGDVRVSREI